MRPWRFAYLLLILALGAVWSPAGAFENVNMDTSITVQDGQLVAHWNGGSFDHYNVRWSANGGAPQQVERAGDKNFVFLTAFRPGVVYTVAVQGCQSNFAAHSTCTSWDEQTCGTVRAPCGGPAPLPIVNGGRLCLDVDAAQQHANGGRVQLWACNGQDQQQWTLTAGRVVSLAGKCLDVNLPEIHNNGGRVQVWDCNGSIQQRWALSSGQLRNAGGKCLDVDAASLKQNGTPVRVWDCNGATQQRWSQPSNF